MLYFNFSYVRLKSYIYNIILFIVLISLFHCVKSPSIVDNLNNSKSLDSVIINISFKKETDKKSSTFQRYDTINFGHYPIISAPNHLKLEENLKTKLLFKSKVPINILIGFNEIIVFPNTEIDVNYEVLKNDGRYFEDTIIITSPEAYILNRGTSPLNYFNKSAFDILISDLSEENISKYINIDYVLNQVNHSLNQLNLDDYTEEKKEYLKTYLKSYYAKAYFITLILIIRDQPTQLIRQQSVIDKIKLLSNHLNTISTDFKDYKYWVTMDLFYKYILNNDIKSQNYSIDAIKVETKNYDSQTQQFIYLNAIKAAYALDYPIDKSLLQEIKHPRIVAESKTLNSKENGYGLFENSIELLNTNLKPISLKDVFKLTTQDLVYLDFSGSWCVPCIKEIERYSKLKKYDNSNRLRPIWIFFENNQKDWFNVIEKYNLNKENCFLVIGENAKNMTKVFGENYLWAGEFPHHFLFSSNGKALDLNAKPLDILELGKILPSTAIPAPPPRG